MVPFSSVTQSCLTLCDPTDCSMPGLPVHHQLPELTKTHVHWIGDAIQPFHPVSLPSPVALNPSQYQGLFQSRGKPTKCQEIRWGEQEKWRGKTKEYQKRERDAPGENWSEVQCSLWVSSSLLITCIQGWREKQTSKNKNKNTLSTTNWHSPWASANGNPLQYSCLENPMDGGAS